MWIPGNLTKHNKFMADVAAMMSGKAIAAAIALVTMPLVARLFAPSDFGVAAAFLSIVSITSNVGSLRYEMALVLPKSDAEATVLLALSYRILLVICTAMLIVLGLYRLAGMEWALLELLGSWTWLLPFGVLLMAGLQVQEQWLGRKRAFKLVGASTALGSAVTSTVRLSFGAVSGSSVSGLVSGNLLGLLSRFALQKSATAEGVRAALSRFEPGQIRQLAKRFRDFPKLNAPAALVFTLGQNLPVLLFGLMFSPAVAGFYAMANRLSHVPIVIGARSTRRVFLQKAAEVHNRGKSLRKAFLLTTGVLALLGAVPFGTLWLFGQPLLGWLLGERWLEAGRYLEIMSPWLLMVWVTAPANPVFIVLRKQAVWLTMQVCLTLLRLMAFGLAYLYSAGPEWTLQAFVVATVLGNIFTIGVTIMLISKHSTSRPPADPRVAVLESAD
jgi:lipopolysaccharide exporter